ncbi:YbbR-like domain-containing protein [Flagellimonas algicola]|uniref:YbbR-like domain-containing protein n=1 Tax=Flagellimonas algicola TaxID=2583815 RepID=A0ABY2WP84_9FLAO|nr:CdaR family protein [Allomuricauda algicola]TMU56807.1 YbbR-like domain-containing protein [Allomuricauda algicola]
MVKKFLQGLNRRKVKVFFIFLLCSFLAWFLSNLSESYESRVNFDLNYRNLPDTLLLGNNAVNTMEAKLRTSGFQFLYYKFWNKRVNVNLGDVQYRNGRYMLSEDALKKQIEQQLSQNISLLDLDRRQLTVDLYQVNSKEVPVVAQLDVQFAQNFILDGAPVIKPATVTVKGPKKEIDTIRHIFTSKLEMAQVSSDFSEEVLLIFPRNLVNSIFSTNRVEVSGAVVKFSEEVFEVPVKVVNLPEGYQIQTFPNSVSVLCKATVERLKSLSAADIKVIADYRQLRNSDSNELFLEILETPEKVYDLRLLVNKVNFVLEQQ